MLGVQAQGASPIVAAFEAKADVVPSGADTVADSIAVGTPRNWRRALAWVRASRGAMIAVPDDEILDAMRHDGAARRGVRRTGRRRPASPACARPSRRASCRADATALAVITGNGLKDIRAAHGAAGQPHDIRPDLDAVEAIVQR